jgi:serine/threonine protein kinase
MSVLKCIAKSLIKNLGNLGGSFIGVPVAGDIVVEAWDRWEKETDEQGRRRDVQELAQLQIDDLREQIKLIVAEQAAGLIGSQQQMLADYLRQVPAAIRRSLRRPADPTGTTVPAKMRLRSANDLLPLLPPRLPRFRPGTRPWENSDLQLIEMLGQGGFGEVWKAKHLDRPHAPPVALKFCTDEQAIKSLDREKDLLDRVSRLARHDGMVQLLYAHLRNDPPCLEYEYVEGGELSRLITALHADGPPNPEKVARILLKLARIVAFAHQQKPPVVHRDLKPANILVSASGKGYRFKIADFGIGAVASRATIRGVRSGQTGMPERKTMTVSGAYTPLYASPQQIDGEPADPRDDVHALGVIWYQLLTNRTGLLQLPSDWRDDLRALNVPTSHQELLADCIASKPERRPPDAAELVTRLAKLSPAEPASGAAGTAHLSSGETKTGKDEACTDASEPERSKRSMERVLEEDAKASQPTMAFDPEHRVSDTGHRIKQGIYITSMVVAALSIFGGAGSIISAIWVGFNAWPILGTCVVVFFAALLLMSAVENQVSFPLRVIELTRKGTYVTACVIAGLSIICGAGSIIGAIWVGLNAWPILGTCTVVFFAAALFVEATEKANASGNSYHDDHFDFDDEDEDDDDNDDY